MSNGGPGVTSDSNQKSHRPTSGKGDYLTGGPTIMQSPAITELKESERGSTPSPTKTQGSEVSSVSQWDIADALDLGLTWYSNKCNCNSCESWHVP